MAKDIYSCFMNSPHSCIKHSTYFKSYEHFFSKYQNREVTFIEIGVLNGGSLFMWREYFGPQARIIGIDLNPDAKKWEKDGFEIYIGSQADEKFWSDVVTKVGGIDIVLDDGGHTYEQQIITTENLLDAINDDGIIVVEDTHTSYMNGYGPKKYSFMNYVSHIIDRINFRSNLTQSMPNSERRIWSIEIVESMVAFKINRSASNEHSEIVENNGIDHAATDFRYDSNKFLLSLRSFARKFKFLQALPFARSLYDLLQDYLANRKFDAKSYFKNY